MRAVFLRGCIAASVLLAACSDINSPTAARRHDLLDDVTPPAIVGAAITPASVDVTTGEAVLTAQIQISDDLSGVGTCSLTFTSPSGQHSWGVAFSSSVNLISGTSTAGIMQNNALLPQFSEPGVWTLTIASCADNTGNRVQYDQTNPWPYAPLTFNVASAVDTQAPQLNSVSIAPAVVDVSVTDGVVGVTMSYSDDLSGVAQCSATFTSPSGQHNLTFAAFAPNDIISGTAQSGVLQRNALVPVHSEPGAWNLTSEGCRDQAGNSATAAPVVPLHLEVIGAVDNTPPAITALSVTPDPIDVSSNDALITMHLSFSDVGLGIALCNVLFVSPSGQQQKGFPGSPNYIVSGDRNTGTMDVNALLPQYSETGTWTLQSATCSDAAGNSTTYNSVNPLPFPAPVLHVGPPSVRVLLLQLIDRVASYHSLQVKLSAALQQLDRNNKTAAANQIGAFTNEVRAMVSAGRLSVADGNAFLSLATQLLTRF